MHTGGVSEAALAPLRDRARLVRIGLLPTSDDFNAAHARDRLHGLAPFTKGEKPAFHTPLDNFAKLRLWQLDYERVVFLDADTLVLQPIGRLFDYPEFCAAPNVYEGLGDFHRMNSGVFTARPDPATFAPSAAAMPPWAQPLAQSSSARLVSSATRCVRDSCSAAVRPARPLPTMRTSTTSGSASGLSIPYPAASSIRGSADT